MNVNGRALITDFGLALVTQSLDSIWSATDECAHAVRWTAPEILNGWGTYSKEGDVFSLAMVTIEVFMGDLRVEFWLGVIYIFADIHRRNSIRGQLTYRSFVVHTRGEAPTATDQPNPSRRVVGIDPALLESRSTPPPASVRGVA